MRVEGTLHDDPLHPFELEVREKLAVSTSPLDELVQKETKGFEHKKLRVTRAKLTRLSKEGAFTSRQKMYFELFYIERIPDKEISERLDVSRSTVRRFRQEIFCVLKRFLSRKEDIRSLLKFAPSVRLTSTQKLIFKLRYRQGLSVAEIARKLGRQACAVHRVLQRTKKNFPRRNVNKP